MANELDEMAPPAFWDYRAFEAFVRATREHYQHSAPTVAAYLDDLYQRIQRDEDVQLREIATAQALYMDGEYDYPAYAANRIYRLKYDLGMDTSNDFGF